MSDRYNPFGLPYLDRPAETPNYAVDSRWPDQPDVANAFKMGGLAGTDQYAPTTYAPFDAYDRAQQAQHRDERQQQAIQRSADVARGLSGQHGPADIRPVVGGMRMADMAGEMLAPDDVFGATTLFNPVRIGRKAIPAAAGAILGSDTAEAGARPRSIGSFLTPKHAATTENWIMGGLADPNWHGVSGIKLTKPLHEFEANRVITRPIQEHVISPEALQGGWLLPAWGDRAMADAQLRGVGGRKFELPTELQGGHGYMPGNTDLGQVWASDKGVISTMAGRARRLAEQEGAPVYIPYTAMSERSVDFSHHMSDTLAEMLKDAKIIKASKDPKRGTAETFDAAMREPKGKDFPVPYPDFPGVLSPELRQYLVGVSGKERSKLAQLMDASRYQSGGFPNVAEARFAVTDPRLLHQPSGAAGMSISRVNPDAITPSGHRTYNTALGGEYIGGFERPVPKEIMYPDIIRAHAQRTSNPSQQDYLFRSGSAPVAQRADDQWLEGVMRYLEGMRNGPR